MIQQPNGTAGDYCQACQERAGPNTPAPPRMESDPTLRKEFTLEGGRPGVDWLARWMLTCKRAEGVGRRAGKSRARKKEQRGKCGWCDKKKQIRGQKTRVGAGGGRGAEGEGGGQHIRGQKRRLGLASGMAAALWPMNNKGAKQEIGQDSDHSRQIKDEDNQAGDSPALRWCLLLRPAPSSRAAASCCGPCGGACRRRHPHRGPVPAPPAAPPAPARAGKEGSASTADGIWAGISRGREQQLRSGTDSAGRASGKHVRQGPVGRQ
jgi:hypothetical protein